MGQMLAHWCKDFSVPGANPSLTLRDDHMCRSKLKHDVGQPLSALYGWQVGIAQSPVEMIMTPPLTLQRENTSLVVL